MSTAEKVKWHVLDAETLPRDSRKIYEAYMQKWDELSRLQTELAAALTREAKLSTHHRIVVSHRFGKLSAAVEELISIQPSRQKGGMAFQEFVRSVKSEF